MVCVSVVYVEYIHENSRKTCYSETTLPLLQLLFQYHVFQKKHLKMTTFPYFLPGKIFFLLVPSMYLLIIFFGYEPK
jgi:hypothetical protein